MKRQHLKGECAVGKSREKFRAESTKFIILIILQCDSLERLAPAFVKTEVKHVGCDLSMRPNIAMFDVGV